MVYARAKSVACARHAVVIPRTKGNRGSADAPPAAPARPLSGTHRPPTRCRRWHPKSTYALGGGGKGDLHEVSSRVRVLLTSGVPIVSYMGEGIFNLGRSDLLSALL